ncbi:MAG: GNAT family N-acetyltransferase [Vitreimonas sp.]
MRVEPLTPEHWPALEKLFGKQGACMGCWCMYWQLPRKQWNAARGAGAKRLFKQRVNESPPGVVAFIEDDAAGWLQIGPRADAPQWNGARRVSAPVKEVDAEDPRVWATTCFYVKSSARGQGVSQALLKAGIDFAKKNGARAIEACPIDGDASPGAAYVGRTPLFERARFREIARRKPNRPLMRLIIKR